MFVIDWSDSVHRTTDKCDNKQVAIQPNKTCSGCITFYKSIPEKQIAVRPTRHSEAGLVRYVIWFFNEWMCLFSHGSGNMIVINSHRGRLIEQSCCDHSVQISLQVEGICVDLNEYPKRLDLVKSMPRQLWHKFPVIKSQPPYRNG